jgi:hypothetical protein
MFIFLHFNLFQRTRIFNLKRIFYEDKPVFFFSFSTSSCNVTVWYEFYIRDGRDFIEDKIVDLSLWYMFVLIMTYPQRTSHWSSCCLCRRFSIHCHANKIHSRQTSKKQIYFTFYRKVNRILNFILNTFLLQLFKIDNNNEKCFAFKNESYDDGLI